jgi:hypothetical protein
VQGELADLSAEALRAKAEGADTTLPGKRTADYAGADPPCISAVVIPR